MPSNEFAVVLDEQAEGFLLEKSRKIYEKAIHSLLLLRTTPFIGRVYDPEFESAKPPEGCRRLVVSNTNIEIFYMVDEKMCRVDVVYIDDARMDPKSKFKDIEEV